MGTLRAVFGRETSIQSVPVHEPRGVLGRYVFSTDHKVIGIQFFLLGLVMLAFGGFLALLMRYQLAWPFTKVPIVGEWLFPGTGGAMTPEVYTALFTLHGTVMVFFVVIPLLTGAFGNYLIPMMIGAPDMAFPRMNALAFWMLTPGVACLVMSMLSPGGGSGAGWTAYPPLSTVGHFAPGSLSGQSWWLMAVTFAGVSSLLGALNYVVTVVKMRAPGLTAMRMPLTVWGLLIAALLQLFALPVLTSGTALMAVDRAFGAALFSPGNAADGAGGQPLLWQHLFWFYSHPAVYVMVLPAMGMVSDILSVHSRKPVFGYRPMVFAMMAIAGLGFIVWGHHMFTSGMDPRLEMAFLASTMLIAVPSGVKTFNWLGTLWGARIRLTTANLFAIGFVAQFVIGGLSGLWLASTPIDSYMHDTYTVVAHFHYIVFGASLFALFGGIYHWWPKFTGRRMHEGLGRIHFVGTFLGTNAVFLMMHQLGLRGMIRRTADPLIQDSVASLQPLNVFITWAAVCLVTVQAVFLLNLVYGLFFARRGEENPWRAASLEWESASPPPAGNFRRVLWVERGPYEYSVRPENEVDYLPQAAPMDGRVGVSSQPVSSADSTVPGQGPTS